MKAKYYTHTNRSEKDKYIESLGRESELRIDFGLLEDLLRHLTQGRSQQLVGVL